MHLESQGTRTAEALETLKALGHSKDTWTLGHSKGTWALKALGHLASLAVEHSGTQKALGHLGTQALGNLGTRATRGTLLADSFRDSEKKSKILVLR